MKDTDAGTGIVLSANDRFKCAYGKRTAQAVVGAALLHFALFQFFPQLNAADLSVTGDELTSIELPPEVKIPPPPEQIARPATPKVAAADVDEDITIAPTTFEDNPVENLPPPPKGGNVGDRPVFVAREVEPKLKNTAEIRRLLQRDYPSMLREAGIGGTVMLWVLVDKAGNAKKSQVNKSSGYPALDEASRRVASKMKFSPALNRDKPVEVWIVQPVRWNVGS